MFHIFYIYIIDSHSPAILWSAVISNRQIMIFVLGRPAAKLLEALSIICHKLAPPLHVIIEYQNNSLNFLFIYLFIGLF